ncbi:hypothetical protein T4B_2933 [Trichinella pseudospiralis]|uniref:Uncharacterized protein n=1 Tax=Trichinella pseudospiralis TaxID=6337 RepID=A0A0V1GLE9_TRIPS|nr:hypothetical protein T4B_2933 [Trichinella pseudospiralis]
MYAELEGLAESLSDDDHVEKADIFIDEMNVHIDVEEGADPSMKAVQWLCSIAERASYMHAGETCYLEAILVTGDMDSKNKNIMKKKKTRPSRDENRIDEMQDTTIGE